MKEMKDSIEAERQSRVETNLHMFHKYSEIVSEMKEMKDSIEAERQSRVETMFHKYSDIKSEMKNRIEAERQSRIELHNFVLKLQARQNHHHRENKEYKDIIQYMKIVVERLVTIVYPLSVPSTPKNSEIYDNCE